MSRASNGLFNDADLKSVELSGYGMGRGGPQNYQLMQEPTIPSGAVHIDESVQLPAYGHQTERLHLPAISQHHHASDHLHSARLSESSPTYQHSADSSRLSLADQYSPNEPQPSHNHHHSEHLSHSHPVSHDHHASHHHHQQHEQSQQHQHHHHQKHQHQHQPQHQHQQHQHQHEHQQHQHQQHQHQHQHQHQQHQHQHQHGKEVETYDPRWWYLPVGSVHSPKSWRLPEYRYVPPKWYEPPRTYGKILKSAQELRLPPRKYIDCQCQVCKPTRGQPQGIKWVVNK